MCTKNYDQIMYCLWDMVCDRCIFHFGAFFALLPSLKNQNFEKNNKNIWRYHYFTYVYQNYDQMMYSSWDKVCDRQTDGQTNGWWKKWHIEVGAPPKKLPLGYFSKKSFSQFIMFTQQINRLRNHLDFIILQFQLRLYFQEKKNSFSILGCSNKEDIRY